MGCKGAIFDLDGVITATAQVHFRAWKRTFEEFREFTHDRDYVPYVDGKPRYQGVSSRFWNHAISLYPTATPLTPPVRTPFVQ